MSEKLLTCRLKRPEAKVRLVCFPWSGTGASAFTAWAKELPATVEVVGVTLAGRETRYKEPCNYSAKDVAAVIAAAIHQRYSDKPLFVYGHSLGAMLCQEVAATLRADYGLEPAHLYVSGESPPHPVGQEVRLRKDYREMDEDTLKKEVINLGCLPFNVLTNKELLSIYLPALRADLTLVHQLCYDIPCRLKQTPLSCALTVLEAVEDIQFDIQGWKALSSGVFRVKQFGGAHFFMKDPHNQKLICDMIAADVESYVTSL
ncbi:hypothetical protein ACOMHN_023452 [Nucella lapillus]